MSSAPIGYIALEAAHARLVMRFMDLPIDVLESGMSAFSKELCGTPWTPVKGSEQFRYEKAALFRLIVAIGLAVPELLVWYEARNGQMRSVTAAALRNASLRALDGLGAMREPGKSDPKASLPFQILCMVRDAVQGEAVFFEEVEFNAWLGGAVVGEGAGPGELAANGNGSALHAVIREIAASIPDFRAMRQAVRLARLNSELERRGQGAVSRATMCNALKDSGLIPTRPSRRKPVQ